MPGPIYSPAVVSTALNNAAQSTGVPISTLTALCQNESSYGGNPNLPAVGASGEVGIMQMTPVAIAQINQTFHTNYTSADMNDPGLAAMAGAQYEQYLLQHYNGDTDAAFAAFNSPAAVNAALAQYHEVTPATLTAVGYGPDTPHGNNVAGYLQRGQDSMGTSGNIAPSNAVPQTNAAAIAGQPNPLDPMPDPIAVSPLPTQQVSTQQLADINPLSVPDQLGLSWQPWYQDTNLLTGNPRLHKLGFPQGFPIVFEVYMDQTNPNSLLKSGAHVGSNSLIGSLSSQPLIIPLNCSLKTFKIASRHIMNREPTRTGYHITMWGMAADVIEGSGSTGLFMNQYGVTDFLSLAGTNTDAVNAVLSAYTFTQSGVDLEQVYLPTGNPSAPKTPIVQQPANYNAQQNITGSTYVPQNYVEPFRIAAEDAFQEFLALFKMNGTTYLHGKGYQFDPSNNNAPDTVSNANSANALSVYSTGVGATDVQIKARNNDVYKRGFVVMKFRGSQYLGFFKSLSWALDANTPYQWKFNFVFQVERTLSLVYYASPQSSPVSSSNVELQGFANNGLA